MNFLTLAGRLGADPETRMTPAGQKVTTLRVAVSVRKKGKEDTIWWRVTVWGDRYDKMMSYLKKGSAVMVFGEMSKPEIYTDKEGRPQISMEMTAEHLAFSPFGKSERSGSEQTSGEQSSFNSFAASSRQGSFGEPVEPAFNAMQYFSENAGKGQEDDDMPF